MLVLLQHFFPIALVKQLTLSEVKESLVLIPFYVLVMLEKVVTCSLDSLAPREAGGHGDQLCVVQDGLCVASVRWSHQVVI